MVKYPDVTIVIQGPIVGDEKQTWKMSLDYFKRLFGEIVLSTYTEQITDETVDFCKTNDIVLTTISEDIGDLEKQYNISYQTLSVLNGLESASKKYCLKHRTDECYSNLEKLIDKFMEDPSKWVCTTTIFGESSYCQFHAGDHLYIGERTKLLDTFRRTKQQLLDRTFVKNNAGEPAAEITFTKNWIRASGDEPAEHRHYEQMLTHFDLINDKELMPFIIRINSIKKTCTTPEELEATRNIKILSCNTIRDILHS